ncbi:P-loop containing nucleoside triphosphate hydrolase protein [Scheffersomyces coipomensis]|uniref:P-loop containing nucleoside triphosphate hydrolase protein n=1 Tax=Scheffersomyces coipomensis TaxID=1788519 RepID=UPI00315DD2DC
MSNNPADVATSENGSKRKRKRKRNNNNNNNNNNNTNTVKDDKPESKPDVNGVKDNEFHIHRSNKKIKFDEEEVEEVPNGKVNDIEELGEEVIEDQDPDHSEGYSSDIEKSPSVEIETKLSAKIDKPKQNIANNDKKIKKKAKTVAYKSSKDSEDEEDEDDYTNRFTHSSLTKAQLKIYQHKDDIIEYIKVNQITIVIGETGSGKSTQIPQFLLPINKQQIAVTQPRRVAAASLAQRVSEEYGCQLGEEVGYQVRFSNITSQKTKLKYLTDGMLLREIMLDGKLSKYSTIILDEAHERTILTDLIMGFLKQLIVNQVRPDLKVIIMSATLNAELFSNFFGHAPILFIEGKMYPVTPYYLLDSSEDIVDSMIRTVIQVNMSEQEGDVLCFLPGQEEIDNCVAALNQIAPQLPKTAPIIVPLPLYAALSPSQQANIFNKLPARRRKVILATNIAETSITVSGVKYVIDSGLRKVKVWKHQLGLSTLLTAPISQASAKQRAGRAGRESEGKVFRLYSEKVFQTKLPSQQESEIMRNDIILPVLTLKKLNVDDLLNWSWLEHPGKDAILSALNTLYALGALDNNGKITSLGFKMSVLPLPPQLSVALITAFEKGVLGPVIDIVSCLSVDNLILNIGGNGELRDDINFKRREFCPLGTKYGDLIAFKEYFNYYQELSTSGHNQEVKDWCKDLHLSFKGFKNVLKVRNQLKEYMFATIKQDGNITQSEKDKQLRILKAQFDESSSLDSDNEDEGVKSSLDIPTILKAFLKGYITNTAIGMPDRSYRTFTSGQLISVHPSSNLFGKSNLDAITYIEYVYTSKGYGRTCSAIELSWLQEVAPHMLGAAKINIKD